MASYLRKIPTGLNEEVLLNLPFSEAREKCELFGLCGDEKFWKKYANHKFKVVHKSENLSYFRVAEMCDIMLQEMFSKNSHPSITTFEKLFGSGFINSEEDFEGIFLYLTNRPANRLSTAEALIKYQKRKEYSRSEFNRKYSDIPTNFGSLFDEFTDLNQLNEKDRKIASLCLSRVNAPLGYFTPEGIVEIPFDVDFAILLIDVNDVYYRSAFTRLVQNISLAKQLEYFP